MTRTNAHSFSSGEVTPELFGRIDLGKLQSALAVCRNFEVLPHGPVVNRSGTEYVAEVKDSTKRTRLIPFTYSITQTMVIQLGAGYFRFHSQAGTLLSLGVPYEVANPYAEADLFDIHYVQSADVLTLVHPNYPIQELRRLGATNWTLTAPTFQAPTNAPTAVSASNNGQTGSTQYQYVVTAVNQSNLEETIGSTASAAVTNDLTLVNHFNTITWTAASGSIVRYNVYKLANGLYGFIGQGASTNFVDNNITPDVSRTPPINDTGFNDAPGNYPSSVTYFEQRRCFAGSTNFPQNFYATKSGTESNLSYSIPTRDDNRISFRIASREASAIRHIVPAASLILLTPSCEFRVNPNGEVLTPSSVAVKPQTYIGSNNVTPIQVGNSILFAQSRGGRIREMSYTWQQNGYQTNDISILAPHLFDYNNIIDMAYSRAPYPILWCISSNGNLLGMTYVPEQQIAAWHRHDTQGTFESVCTITETPTGQTSSEDMVYVIVRRLIGGVYKRFVERKHTRGFVSPTDAFFVDCGATYNGAATTTVTGLNWLEGQTVSILADAAVQPQQVVTGGKITLQNAASIVQVGLPITADLQTVPLALQIDTGAGIGKPKNINKVWMRVQRSSGIYAGPSFTKLIEVKERTNESWGVPPSLKSGEVSVEVSPSWGSDGALCVRQSDPLPLTIVSISMDVATGG